MLLSKGYVISKRLTEKGLLEKMGFSEKKANVVREEIISACANCVL
jgi:N-acetylglutamate synthase-like GNAT family acetyltransferase